MSEEVVIHYNKDGYQYGESHAFQLYTGVGPLEDQPLPYVSLSNDSVHYGKRWGSTQKVTLNGQITGANQKNISLVQSALVDRFSKSFRTFSINEGTGQRINCPENLLSDGLLYVMGYAKVESISFAENNYVGVLDYTIQLSDYCGDWSGELGIVDPKDSWSFSDSEDGTATVSHSVSARGMIALVTHYDDNDVEHHYRDPINNARDWVRNHSGSASMPQPYFVGSGKTAHPILMSVSENMNRTDGTYSVQEEYSYNTGESLQPVTTHEISLDSGIESDFVSVNYTVNLRGGKTIGLNDIRESTDYKRYITDAKVFIESETDVQNLNPTPITFSVNEDTGANSIQYQATFDNNNLFSNALNDNGNDSNLSNAYWDYTVNINTDEIRGFTTVSVDGPIVSRGDNLPDKITRAERFAKAIDEKGFAYTLAKQAYDDFVSEEKRFTLGKIPNSFSINENKFTSEYSVSAQFDDKFEYSNGSKIPKRTSYSIDITPARQSFKPKPACNENGYYVVYDTNAKTRESLGINLEIDYNGKVTKSDASEIIDEMHQNIVNQYCSSFSKIVTNESQSLNDQMNTVTYSQQLTQSETNQGLGSRNPILRYNFYYA